MSTPEPVYQTQNSVQVDEGYQVDGMPYPMKARYRRAASVARSEYPGPIGECIARELLTVEEFGWALGADSFGTKLLHAIEKLASYTPPPTTYAMGIKPRITPTIHAQSQVRAQ